MLQPRTAGDVGRSRPLSVNVADWKITVENAEELARVLDSADALFAPLASKAIATSLVAIEEEIAPYPPQPSRTRAKTFNTYVRGQGQYPKSAFVPDTNEPGGFRTKKVSRGKIRMTSQNMAGKWKQSVKTSQNAVLGTLWNEATYSGYVSGHKDDKPKQVAFHAQTGWVSTDDAIEQAMPGIEKTMNSVISDFLDKITGR